MNKLSLIYEKNGERRDITAVSSNYSRSDNVDALGMDFHFEMLVNMLDENFSQGLENGGIVMFSNNDELVFAGIIVEDSRNGITTRSYTAYDFAYYLNKSEAMKQYDGISVSEAIRQLCNEFNIPVGNIVEIPTLVKAIYNGNKISDIIRDLLKKATAERGEKYRFEVRLNKLYVERYTDLIIDAKYVPYAGGKEFNITDLPGEYAATYSIADMCNRITVVASSEKHAQVYGMAEDAESIKYYGLLTKIEKVDDKNSAQAQNIAVKKLSELNKVQIDRSLKFFGDDKVRSGRLLVFNKPEIDLVGTFLVKNCVHNYTPALHTMSLSLAVI